MRVRDGWVLGIQKGKIKRNEITGLFDTWTKTSINKKKEKLYCGKIKKVKGW